ncbi:MAG: hypothetical protein OXD46_02435, partial [Chloroflexi bacterium]|nr:hypothetical protein [Chloroflexota bacterium]
MLLPEKELAEHDHRDEQASVNYGDVTACDRAVDGGEGKEYQGLSGDQFEQADPARSGGDGSAYI